MEQAFLVVIYGNIGNEISTQLVDYMVRGGKLLVLCSDLLHILLPTFKTAEVRENELVRFSYGKWKNVRMMHHIFCYQPSPVKTKFSEEFKYLTFFLKLNFVNEMFETNLRCKFKANLRRKFKDNLRRKFKANLRRTFKANLRRKFKAN